MKQNQSKKEFLTRILYWTHKIENCFQTLGIDEKGMYRSFELTI